jgi:hypothetical protein
MSYHANHERSSDDTVSLTPTAQLGEPGEIPDPILSLAEQKRQEYYQQLREIVDAHAVALVLSKDLIVY